MPFIAIGSLGERAIRLREQLIEGRTFQRRIAVLERELLQRLHSLPVARPAISFALRALHGGEKVQSPDSLRRGSGVGERRFRTLFSQAVGLSPKRFMRVQRVKSVLQRIAESREPLAAIAAEHGYVDQAHMTRELRDIAGVSPSAYRSVARSALHMEVE